MGYEMNVLQSVLTRHGDVAAVGDEIQALRHSEFCQRHVKFLERDGTRVPSTATVKLSDKSSGLPV